MGVKDPKSLVALIKSFITEMCSRGCFQAPLVRCYVKKPSCSVFCGAWFRVLVLSFMDKLKLKCKGIFCNIGCFGCCKKTPGITSMDEASKGLRAQEQTVTKMEGSDGFWSSSTFELDHSEGHSQRSISSIGISNNPSDPRSSGGNQSGLPEFVNHGLLLWNQIRQQWIGKKGSESITEIQEPRISSNATYDTLLGSNKPFPQRIPLREMVDFLVDIWDQEGLYD
ncbi:uncharacterized protein LOC106764670 isoform X3 [Vigna radiata var. radiata]|uniref:Uncharacterized protein LOC106764670 isoform X3 n=1 Tax=Vigna radiata var. radiata TaxID=3916 RepID=A0A3Q0F3V2_VIGRR|nr:uncharacterized protein LOC106764670 isoform X3 [Vigna radiata var. radiata]